MKLLYGPHSRRPYLGISGVDAFCGLVTLIWALALWAWMEG